MNKLNIDLKSKVNKRFKAGDFTSGKMGEIFKTCHHSMDLVYIDHKQFGAANLIPEEYIAFIVCRGVKLNKKFNDFYAGEYKGDDFSGLDYDQAFDVINDFLCDGFESWFDMLTGLLLAWSYENDQDLQNTKTDI